MPIFGSGPYVPLNRLSYVVHIHSQKLNVLLVAIQATFGFARLRLAAKYRNIFIDRSIWISSRTNVEYTIHSPALWPAWSLPDTATNWVSAISFLMGR